MLELERIVQGAKLRGIAGPSVVEVVRVEWIGSDALNVVYRQAQSLLANRTTELAEVAARLGVARPTVYRAIARASASRDE
jgi:hypothetical protein